MQTQTILAPQPMLLTPDIFAYKNPQKKAHLLAIPPPTSDIGITPVCEIGIFLLL